MNAVPRLKNYAGPVLLSYGFRPFFLLGAVYAGLAVLAWLPIFHGELQLRTVEVGAGKHRNQEVRALRLDATGEVGLFEIGAGNISARQICATQFRAFEIGGHARRAAQLR